MPRKVVSNSVKSSKRKSASKRFHTSSLTMEEPSDSHIQTFRSTTQSSSTLPQELLMPLWSSRTVLYVLLPEETISEELVLSSPLRSIQVHSRLPTWEILLVTSSPQDSQTLSSLVMPRSQLSLFQRVKVSRCPSWKKEKLDKEEKNQPAKKKMTNERSEFLVDVSSLRFAFIQVLIWKLNCNNDNWFNTYIQRNQF